MIKVFLGNLGSGKTICAVRELVLNESDRVTYTNIITKGVKGVSHIKPDHVIKKIMKDKKPNFELNIDYWAKQKKPLNVLWDEVHLTANSRQSTSKINIILSRFIAMARRVTGFDKRGYGHLIFIAQKERTIDVNIKELANEIVYHIAHWVINCEDCGRKLWVTSQMQIFDKCMFCGSWKIIKEQLQIEVLKFNDWEKYHLWTYSPKFKLYYDRYIIQDIEKYFKYYDTLQISDVWEDYINS